MQKEVIASIIIGIIALVAVIIIVIFLLIIFFRDKKVSNETIQLITNTQPPSLPYPISIQTVPSIPTTPIISPSIPTTPIISPSIPTTPIISPSIPRPPVYFKKKNVLPELLNNNINTICQLPTGSWTKTCKIPSVQNGIMKASCLDNNGEYKDTTLDLNLCAYGDVSNENGILTCKAGSGMCAKNTKTCNVPNTEPYNYNCNDIRLNGQILYAYCKDNAGNENPTILDLSTCEQGSLIENIDGTLSCTTGIGFCD